jgi:deazaflavin-dependent oxidoreductase (nitroreductase family)
MGEQAPVDDGVLAPTRAVALIRRIGNPVFMATGVGAVLTTKGRRTGSPRRVKLTPVDLDGTTYLMAFQGVGDWVLNLRAAGECELQRKGRSNAYTAIEVEGDERDRVIAKYLSRLPAPVKNDFARRPEPAHHPVFRVEPIAGS